jgi:hypothetical protein
MTSWKELLLETAAPRGRGEIEALRRQTRLTHNVIRVNIDGLTHDDSLIQPRPDGNCLNWVIGHLLIMDQRLLRVLGQAPVMPISDLARYDRGSRPIREPADAIEFDTLAAALAESDLRVDAGFTALPPERLTAPAPFSPNGDPAETVGSLLSLLAFHQSYHSGQTGILRRLAGKEGAIP